MSLPLWREEAIAKKHNRKGFDCGQADLNTFITQYARQAHESGSAKTYCAIDEADGVTILGFYSISPSQIELDRVPLAARPGGGGRHAVGGFRLGRLAVANAYQRQGLGGRLLAMAVGRCMRASTEVGGTALLIDAKDEAGVSWYSLYGAVRVLDRPLSLLIPYVEYNKARVAAGLPPL